jgi:hypothetical protein
MVLGVVALLVIGAVLALSVERLIGATFVPGSPGAVVPTSGPTDNGAVPSDNGAIPSDIPGQSPASPVLEAEIPQSVDGTALTTQSATDASSLTSTPNGRALDAAVTKLGKLPTDLEIALAFDETGTIDLSITGFRIDGIAPATLQPLLLDAWLSASTPGVTTTTTTLAGTPTTEVSYGDGGATEYVLIHGDGVFIIETTDATLAAHAAAAMAAPAPSASPGAG